VDIYEYFEFEVNDNDREMMKNWLIDNPKNKHGVHRYSPERYGLTKKMIDNCFSEYISKVNEYI
jgi:hypothetical protein